MIRTERFAAPRSRVWIGSALQIARLCWAMALAPLLQALTGLVDYAMVSRLGEAALAGTGMAAATSTVVDSILAGIAVGIQTEVARERGCGGDDARSSRPGAALLVLLGASGALALHWLSPLLFASQAPSVEVAEAATAYFQARNVGLPFLALVFVSRGVWFGQARPAAYVAILAGAVLLNVLLNWILIYGRLGLPALGVAGAGWGTALSFVAACGVCAVFHGRRWIGAGMLQAAGIQRTLRAGVPAAVAGVLGLAGVGPVVLGILALVGSTAVAVGSVLMQIALITSIPPLGAAFAATTLVAEELGRGSVAAARSAVAQVAALVLISMSCFGLLLACAAQPLMSVFLHEPAALEDGSFALRLLGFCLGPQSLGVVFMHALLPTRHGLLGSIASVATIWLLALPFAASLAALGTTGVVGTCCLLLAGFGAQTVVVGWLWASPGWHPGSQLSAVQARRT